MLVQIAALIATRDTAAWVVAEIEQRLENMEGLKISVARRSKTDGAVNYIGSVLSKGESCKVVAGSPSAQESTYQFYFGPQSITVFDPKTRQYSSRRSKTALAPKTLAEDASGIDDFLFVFFDKDARKGFFDPLTKLSHWELERGKQTEAKLRTGPYSIVLAADPTTGFLSGVRIISAQGNVFWSVSERPTQENPSFHAPQGAFEVDQIDPKFVDPSYSSPSARRDAEKAFRTFEHPSAIAYSIKDATGTTTFGFRPGEVRQEDDNVAAVFSKGSATVLLKKERIAYEGKLSWPEFIDLMGNVSTPVDPTLRYLFKGTNPLRFYMSGAQVTENGTAKVGTDKCVLLRAKGKQTTVDFVVRGSDGFPMSTTAAANDATSSGMANERDWEPLPAESVRDGSAFRLAVPAGFTKLDAASKITPGMRR